MKYWLVNRDPYNGLWNNPLYKYNPLYNLTNQVFFHCSSNVEYDLQTVVGYLQL